MFDAFESTVGQRIRYYRTQSQMTQKALAETCGITEPAIRNYELGNRIPSSETLNDIAAALQINYYSLADPDLSALAGVMHSLFRMEYAHGLKPIEIDGKAALVLNSNEGSDDINYLQVMMNTWLEARTKFENGEWTPEMYEQWESQYPNVSVSDIAADSDLTNVPAPDKTKKSKQKRGRKPKKTT